MAGTFFKDRYPAGGDVGEKLLNALVATGDFTLAAGLRDELDDAVKKRSTTPVILPKLSVADRRRNC